MFAAVRVARDYRLGDTGNSCELEKAGAEESRRISASRPAFAQTTTINSAHKNAPVSRGVFAIVDADAGRNRTALTRRLWRPSRRRPAEWLRSWPRSECCGASWPRESRERDRREAGRSQAKR